MGQIREREASRSCLGWTCPRSRCTENIPYCWIFDCQVPQHRKGSHHRDGACGPTSASAFARCLRGWSGSWFQWYWIWRVLVCVATVHLQQYRDAETWFVTFSRNDRSKWCRRCKCWGWRVAASCRCFRDPRFVVRMSDSGPCDSAWLSPIRRGWHCGAGVRIGHSGWPTGGGTRRSRFYGCSMIECNQLWNESTIGNLIGPIDFEFRRH